MLATLLIAVLAPAAADAATPTLAYIATVPSADGSLSALSCPATSTCFAAGQLSTAKGAVAVTTNAGKTWKLLTLPSTAGPLGAISCSTASDCIAAAAPPSLGEKSSAARRLDAQPAAVPAVLIATTDGGAVWKVQTAPAGVVGAFSLSCPTAAYCAGEPSDSTGASNGVMWTSNGGSTWSLRPNSATGQANVYGQPISCGTTTACYAGAQGTTPSPALGSVWHDLTGYHTAFSYRIDDSSCPGASACFLSSSGSGGLNAGDNVVDAVTNRGATVVQTELKAGTNSVAPAMPLGCASETTCEVFVVSQNGATVARYSTTSGTSWATQTIPSQAKTIAAVSCPTLGTCVAIGPASSSGTAVVGFTGPAAPAVGGVVQPAGPAAGGQTATVFGSGFASGVTVDFGSKPATGVHVLSANALTAVVPAGTAGTVAVTVHGSGGASASDPDSSYTYLSSAPTVTSVTPSSAAAYGYAQITVKGSGVGFATAVKFGTTSALWWLPTSSSSLIAIAPPGTGTVDIRVTNPVGTSAAGSADRVSYVSSGTGSYSLAQTLAPPPTPTSVSCGSSTVCFAAGGGGILKSSNRGDSWSLVSSQQPTAIACASATTCLAVVAGGVLSTTDGGSEWVSHPYPSGAAGIGVVACLPAGLCFVGVGTKVLSSTDGGATWAAHSLPTALSNPSSLACPTTTACVLTASGELGATSDAGAVWHAVADPSGTAGLDRVSCGTSTTCMAAGYTGNITFSATAYAASTSNAGASWTALPQINSGGAPFVVGGISCTSSKACLVVGNVNFQTSSVPPTGGMVEATADGGQTWTLSSVPSELYGQGFANGFGSGMLYSVSCYASNSCVSVGLAASLNQQPGTAATSVDGGTTWVARRLPATGVHDLTAVSCRTGGSCEAAGDGSYSPVMLGASSATAPFAPQGSPPYAETLDAASCPTASHCVAVGQAGGTLSYYGQGGAIVSGDGGVLWKPTTISLEPENLTSVSCASASDCAAVGTASWIGGGTPLPPVAVSSTDGGSTWNASSLPAGTYSLSDVSCPPTAGTPTCFAVGASNSGNSPTVLRSTNGGASWLEVNVPSDGTQQYTGVSCASSTACIAVGGGAIIATTNGTSWSAQTVPSGAAPSHVACANASACVAVGDQSSPTAAIYTTNGGKTWLAGSTPANALLVSASCSTASDCIASGNPMLKSTNGGKTWSAVTLPSTAASDTGGVSCVPSGTLCLATGAAAVNETGVPAAILRSTSGGSSWSAQIFPLGPAGIGAISCPSSTGCIAGGSSQSLLGGNLVSFTTAYATSDSGATWSDTWPQQLSGALKAISCPSATTCLATDGFDVWRTTNAGGSWTIVTPPAGTNDSNAFHDLACPSTTACLIVGQVQHGQAPFSTTSWAQWTSANEGSTWTETQLPGSLDLNELACPASAKCIATGADTGGLGGAGGRVHHRQRRLLDRDLGARELVIRADRAHMRIYQRMPRHRAARDPARDRTEHRRRSCLDGGIAARFGDLA